MIRLAAWIAAAGLLVAGAPAPLRAQAANAEAAQDAPQTEEQKRAESRLIDVGKETPDFTLPLVGGGEVTLFNLLRGSKAVLVGFWGIEPQHGGEHMERLQKLHEKLESKGVVTVTINPVDDLATVKEFADTKKLHYLVTIDGKETNRAVTNVYKAKVYPTFYLLDPNGKVTWRSVGYREQALLQALEKMGVKP